MHFRQFGAETIAVRIPNWVGDAVMATPALRALRRACPEARIVGVATPPVCRLLAGTPFLDVLEPYSKRRDRGLRGTWAFARRLRAHRARVGIALPHSFSSAVELRLGGVKRLAGYWTRERAWLLHHAPRPPTEEGRRMPRPMPWHYLALLGTLGIPGADPRLELPLSDEECRRAEEQLGRLGLEPGEPYFAVNPGASFGASKFWTVEAFAETIQGLRSRHGARTLVLCGPGEQEMAAAISAAAGEAAVDTSADFLPLELLKPVLRDARALVTTDTGPRHLATAFGTPAVVVMGPTDPRYTACNLERTIVLRHEVDCGPCHLKICPLDHRCMRELTARQALDAVDQLLHESRPELREPDPCQP